jgi:hypothetical protein
MNKFKFNVILGVKLCIVNPLVTIKSSRDGLAGIDNSKTDENCSLLGYYAASSGNILPTFWDNLYILSSTVKNPKESLLSQYGVCIGMSETPEDGTDRWSQNVGKKLPLLSA